MQVTSGFGLKGTLPGPKTKHGFALKIAISSDSVTSIFGNGFGAVIQPVVEIREHLICFLLSRDTLTWGWNCQDNGQRAQIKYIIM
jgi:hypothetical protein